MRDFFGSTTRLDVRPWLTGEEIASAIRAGFEFARQGNARKQTLAHLARAGQQPSNRIGAGLDYAESRDMASGDDPRHINWRASARRTPGSPPLVRAYHPEIEDSAVLVVDARQPMWFASRGRLKLSQAYRWALFHAALHANAGNPLGLLLVREREDALGDNEGTAKSLWIPPRPAQGVLRELSLCASEARTLPSAPATPATVAKPPERRLWPSLRPLLARLPRGARAAIFSEPLGLFDGIDSVSRDQTSATMQLVRQLTRHLTLRVFELLDPLDLALPADRPLRRSLRLTGELTNAQSETAAPIDAEDFDASHQTTLSSARARLQELGIEWQALHTENTDWGGR